MVSVAGHQGPVSQLMRVGALQQGAEGLHS